jgi:hypothetical protein
MTNSTAIIVFFQNDIRLWNANGQLFQTKANAIASAKYQLEGIGGTIKVFKGKGASAGEFDREIKVAA